MILSRRQSFYLIEHLERAVKELTADLDRKAERIKELESQIRQRDETIQKVYRECFL